jgi:hypothetical protein
MGVVGSCEHFIPLSVSDLLDLLCADHALTPGQQEDLRSLAALVTAVHHGDYHRRLQELKRSYAPFDPDQDDVALAPPTAEERQHRLNALYSHLTWLLEHAHFKHLSREEIEPALAHSSDWGIRMDVDFSAFEHVAIFARGDTLQKRTRYRLFNFYRPEEVEVPIYRRLVLILKLRPHPRLGSQVDTANVHLKIFKDIPKLDVMMLLPGARVRLTGLDRGKIGLPLLTGSALALWNILQDVALTLERVLSSPNAMWGLAAGGLGYGYKSLYSYRTLRQHYNLTLTQSLYFQNLDNNGGVLTRLFDKAEEQESRLALLAYYCLWRYGGEGWTAADLDASVELYLDRYADVTLTCLRGAPLGRLQRLGVVQEEAGRWRALPPAQALETLRTSWSQSLSHPVPAGTPRPS